MLCVFLAFAKYFSKNGTNNQNPRHILYVDPNSYHEKPPDNSIAMLPSLNVNVSSKDRKPVSSQDLIHKRHLKKQSCKDLVVSSK